MEAFLQMDTTTRGDVMGFKRTAGCFGIGFVVFQVVGFVVGGSPPGAEDPASEITKYFADGGNALKVGGVLTALASIFALPFIAGFVLPFFKSDREHGEGYGWVVFGGFLLTGAAAMVGLSASFALALRGGAELDAATTRAVWDLSNIAYGSTILFTVAWAGGAAMAIMKRGLMSRWFGIFSGLVALSGFLGIFGLVSAGLGMVSLIGYALLLLWVLVAGVVMLRKQTTA